MSVTRRWEGNKHSFSNLTVFMQDKLAIYDLYAAMTMLEKQNFNIERGGDLMSW